jgi:probable rRNA maturation factor
MVDCRLSIQVEKAFRGLVAEVSLRGVVEATLAVAGVTGTVDIGLAVAGDETVRNLNRTYRGVDNTTDVLAFALSGLSGSDEHFVVPPDGTLHLGEVIISYQQAERQAKEQHHLLERELALLVAHGVLHLLGYDHADLKGTRAMRAMEAKALKAVQNHRAP